MAGSLASGSLAAPTLGQLSSQARALANQSVAAQIAAVRSQQQQDLAQAQQRAHSINAAALAASRYLQSLDLGGKAKADYQTAVGNQTGIAAGYSGQLRTDADAAAKAAQASLASVPGNAQTVTDKGPSLANVLYGLGGAIPATQLNTVEPAAVQAARALTASPIGYGQQEAYGALGAGAQAAQGLAGQIANARAQEPTLTQSYLAQLSQAVRDQQLAQSLIGSRTDAAKTASRNADAAATRADRPVSVAPGSTLVDPNTGKPVYTAPPRPSAAKANAARGGLTTAQWGSATEKAITDAGTFYKGVAPEKQYVPPRYDAAGTVLSPPHWIPVPGTGTPPVPYPMALAQLLARNPGNKAWTRFVRRTLDGLYAPGEGGRPDSAAQTRVSNRTARNPAPFLNAISPVG